MLRLTLIIAVLVAFDAALVALVVMRDRHTRRTAERQAAIARLSEPLPGYDFTPISFPRGMDDVTVEDGRTVRQRRSA